MARMDKERGAGPSVVLLDPGRWTTPERTPWGGRKIPTRYKADVEVPEAQRAWEAVGESWELSFVEPLKSRDRQGRLLEDLIAERPGWFLGEDAALAEIAESLMLKILDAGERLSLQVHPEDDDPRLLPHESGKPEAWVILDAAPGAGVWLGMKDGVERADFEAALARSHRVGAEDEVAALLNFVPVQPGDIFVIEPGTIHAIGRGVTLLEPQRVHPAREGVTYRFWDWGRVFNGAMRPLQVARSFEVTRWGGLRGEDFVAACRREPEARSEGGLAFERCFSFRGMALDRFQGAGVGRLPGRGRFRVLTVTEGALRVGGVRLGVGETAVVAAGAELAFEMEAGVAWLLSPET